MNLKIAHLYPELLNLYGDRGNIISLKKRAEWRGIDVEVKEYKLADEIDFENIDILFIGGGSDREQLLVCQRLKEIKMILKTMLKIMVLLLQFVADISFLAIIISFRTKR